MSRVELKSVVFEFVGHGTPAESPLEKRDRLYLDVGNGLRPGVIDHHHLAAYSGSAASLVLAHPDLIEEALAFERKPEDPFTIVLHNSPDLDCVASAYLAISHLTSGKFPQGAETLARYADGVDRGYLGMSLDNPFSLYSACMLNSHRLSQRRWESDQDMARQQVEEGMRIADYTVRQMTSRGVDVAEVDAFDCPGLFGPRDRDDVRDDIQRYNQKLSDPNSRANRITLRLPGQFGGTREVETLFVRLRGDDPQPAMFFKDWARTDRERCPQTGGFPALLVIETMAPGRLRAIPSVRPDSQVCLRGLGALLDQEESAERKLQFGVDDRVEDPQTGQRQEPRPGYSNSDPWYDGRAHDFTIVDSPRSGTVLTAERIEGLLVEFGRREESELEAVDLPSPGELSASPSVDAGRLQQMSLAAELNKPQPAGGGKRQAADVFISYPRTKLAWVRENLYQPLEARFGSDRIFFDQNSIGIGTSWPAVLGEAIAGCRVFLTVYCPDFFRSDFCQWELQIAITRDPIGTKRIVTPLLLEPVQIPPYCSVIQCTDATKLDVREGIVGIVEELLQ